MYNMYFFQDELIKRVSKVLAGRPIKVKLLRQSSKSSDDLNSPLNQFFRDYIDFKMYGTMYDVEPSYSALVISAKVGVLLPNINYF